MENELENGLYHSRRLLGRVRQPTSFTAHRNRRNRDRGVRPPTRRPPVGPGCVRGTGAVAVRGLGLSLVVHLRRASRDPSNRRAPSNRLVPSARPPFASPDPARRSAAATASATVRPPVTSASSASSAAPPVASPRLPRATRESSSSRRSYAPRSARSCPTPGPRPWSRWRHSRDTPSGGPCRGSAPFDTAPGPSPWLRGGHPPRQSTFGTRPRVRPRPPLRWRASWRRSASASPPCARRPYPRRVARALRAALARCGRGRRIA